MAKAFVLRASLLAALGPERLHWRRRVFCEGPSSLRSAPSGPRSRSSAIPRACAQGTNQRLFLGLGSRIRDSVCVVRRPPFSHYVLGRTPASERRNPRRGSFIKRFLGFRGARSWRSWSKAAKSEPRRGFEQRKSHPLGGASSRRGGPAERSEKGDAAQHTRVTARQFAPYPSAASDGGQKMRRPPAKALLISKSIQQPHDGKRIFGGAERAALGWTLAQRELPANATSLQETWCTTKASFKFSRENFE